MKKRVGTMPSLFLNNIERKVYVYPIFKYPNGHEALAEISV